MIKLEHIKKIYDNQVTAVEDFNLDIGEKEFIVFVGPSGCGKSTVLRMIAGLEEISEGNLLIDDIKCNDLKPKDRDIAMVFQSYALYPHMTVYQNMAFGLEMKKMKKSDIKKKVEEAAEILEITDYLERYPRALSGGQRQRVALGRALVRKPKVFLLDEPLSNLDAKLRGQMRSEIINIFEKIGITFIYVTHDQVEALTMGTRIVVMKKGVIQQVDTPKNIYAHPKNIFVAGFIGSPQMNFIDAYLEKSQEELTIKLLDDSTYRLSAKELKLVDEKYLDGKTLVKIGVRPEHMIISNSGKNTFKLNIDIFEDLGADTIIYGTGLNSNLILKVSSDLELDNQKEIHFTFNSKKIHIFDSTTEQSILK